MQRDNSFFGTEKVFRLLMRLAPPVMLSQLIQALYNIVDSYYIGRYSSDGLAALSVIFPVQLLISALAIGTMAFELIPAGLLKIFTGKKEILSLGVPALRIIGISFVPISLSLVIPTYFQAIGKGKQSMALTILRQICLLIPLAYAFSLLGVNYVWFAFPITEGITALAAYIMYRVYPA